MVGYPHTLNTKEDYLFVKANFPKEKWQGDYQNLLDSMYQWYNVGAIADEAAGTADDTHKIVANENRDGTKTYYQYEKKIDENCKLLRLGFTEAEVKAALA
ncbi:hypothetical protein [uncultured Mitsuokella sp.]|uniref:hypothetical protein n=1 Tax=uncultured Mitsuokella sp. TaxID=453120 RepID=UPI0026DBE37F|nr:hypothetical protein [uncultured Mitsuokella sp.]